MVLWILIATIVVLLTVLMLCCSSNKKLKEEKRVLEEIIEAKEKTIENLQASRVAVKDVIENFSNHAEVMMLIEAGESREEVSRKLGIPLNKIELIIKFDKIKKENASS
ncbi:sigma-70 family RNA polymerase sigma factor [Sulfurovum sp. ST-21]|nr:sigma-70 family RNA polymerase sigma factor [Sulfurovum indicum]